MHDVARLTVMDNKIEPDPDPRSLIDVGEIKRKGRDRIPLHSDDFYLKLATILAQPDVRSCAYFGFGDFKVLELLAAEQQRRAEALNLPGGEAFPFSVLCDLSLHRLDWGSFNPVFSAGILRNSSVFINDFPVSTTSASFLGLRKSAVDIIFSSCPQTLEYAPEGSTSSMGYWIYRVGGRLLARI